MHVLGQGVDPTGFITWVSDHTSALLSLQELSSQFLIPAYLPAGLFGGSRAGPDPSAQSVAGSKGWEEDLQGSPGLEFAMSS